MNKSFKIFISRLLVLVCFLVAADLIGGIVLKSLFNKQRSGKYFTTTHALKDCKEDVIIFGNSHAAQQFDAPLMVKELGTTVFNLGNQGQNLFYAYPLIKTILTYHKPKLIILELDYNELQYDITDYERLSIFSPYYHLNAVVDSAIAMAPDHEIIKDRSALYRYNSTIGYILLNSYSHSFNKSIASLGYDPMPENMCAGEKEHNPEGTQGAKIIFDPVKIATLIKLINYINANHVKLLVTTAPMFQNITQDNGPYKEKLNQLLAGLHVDYFDNGKNPDFTGKCELFHDASHLNATGAALWTKLCAGYIRDKILN